MVSYLKVKSVSHFEFVYGVRGCSNTNLHTGILLYEDLICQLGEGDGTPLQYSFLENPVDGGAWKAAVHGVTKSRT